MAGAMIDERLKKLSEQWQMKNSEMSMTSLDESEKQKKGKRRDREPRDQNRRVAKYKVRLTANADKKDSETIFEEQGVDKKANCCSFSLACFSDQRIVRAVKPEPASATSCAIF